MKLPPNRLDRQLREGLAPVYAISGDEPLQCLEAADAIRKHCRSQGFDERQVFHVDNSFDWNLLREAGASLSLFAEKRLLELRMPGGKPSEDGSKALLEYLQRPAEDTLLLISLPRLDSKAQKTRWGKALLESEHCQFIQIWPIEPHNLQPWLRDRLAARGLSASAEALELLAARVEGNLLAAEQEIARLQLLAEGGNIDLDSIQSSVGDSARFDLFGLLDAALAGEAAHALRMLNGLRGEGDEPPVILWGIARELRNLISISEMTARGMALDKACASVTPRIFGKRQGLIGRAVGRSSLDYWNALLLETQLCDEQIKGQSPGDPWITLSRLVLQIAGQRLPLPAG